MNCKELAQLIPDMVDGALAPEVLAEAQAALPNCPDCQRELALATRIHEMLLELQAENAQFRVPAGFEARLLERIHNQSGGLDMFELSSKALGAWLIELINLLGGLFDLARANQPTPTGV